MESKTSKKPEPIIKIGIEDEDYTCEKLEKKHLGKNIYKIEYSLPEDNVCANYIDDASKFVVFQNKNCEYVLFHLENKPIQENIIELCKKALSKKRIINRHQDLAKNVVLLQSCVVDIDLNAAQTKLDSLNEKLQTKCPHLLIKLNHFFDYKESMPRYSEHNHVCVGCRFYDTLILALCTIPQEKCISTIEIAFSSTGEVLINSKTDTEDEGKKYNKLLRSVLLIIGNKIENAQYIKSIAVNPASAWLLLKYSKASIEPGNHFEEYLQQNNYSLESITQEILKDYYDAKNKPIHLIVPLNKTTADNSNKEFMKLVADESIANEIKC
jgi:hypothetical protein